MTARGQLPDHIESRWASVCIANGVGSGEGLIERVAENGLRCFPSRRSTSTRLPSPSSTWTPHCKRDRKCSPAAIIAAKTSTWKQPNSLIRNNPGPCRTCRRLVAASGLRPGSTSACVNSPLRLSPFLIQRLGISQQSQGKRLSQRQRRELPGTLDNAALVGSHRSDVPNSRCNATPPLPRIPIGEALLPPIPVCRYPAIVERLPIFVKINPP
jgi:hypothetical protein